MQGQRTPFRWHITWIPYRRTSWRLISVGFIKTPERDHRHRRKKGKILRSCGEAEPDVIHISWKCKQFQQLRSQALALPKALLIGFLYLPICFQYATIVPVDPIHIGYHMAARHEERIPPNPSNPESAHEVAEHQPVASSKGLFFKAVAKKWSFNCLSLKHQRLKITNKPCKDAHLPKNGSNHQEPLLR